MLNSLKVERDTTEKKTFDGAELDVATYEEESVTEESGDEDKDLVVDTKSVKDYTGNADISVLLNKVVGSSAVSAVLDRIDVSFAY